MRNSHLTDIFQFKNKNKKTYLQAVIFCGGVFKSGKQLALVDVCSVLCCVWLFVS